MDTQLKQTFVVAIFITALLLRIFGGGIATGSMIAGGNLVSSAIAGISWLWLAIPLALAVDIALPSRDSEGT